jgi:predicted ester cyclase
MKLFSLALVFIFISCDRRPDQEIKTANKNAVSSIYKMFESGDLSNLDEYVHKEMLEHTPDPMIIQTGIEGLKELIRINHIAFPDLKIKVYNMTAEGDLVYTHFNFSGTNTGPIHHAEPTFRSIDIDGVDIVKIVDGKIAEHWSYWDTVKFINQLGNSGE